MAYGTQSLSSRNASQSSAVRTGAGRSAGFGDRLVALFDRLAGWSERRRQRRALESLSDHMLSDIGLSRLDAEREAEKPFWRG